MANQLHLNLRHIIDVLKRENSSCLIHWQKVKLYDIDPWEFLSFARQDLEEDTERGRINALSNAKRAIECRADELLVLLNFRYFSAKYRWGLPYKMRVLKTFGISAPDVLTNYITSKRNLLEHQYVRPKEAEQISYIADITELFLSASDRYIENGYISSAEINYAEEGEWQKKSARWNTKTSYRDNYVITFDLEGEVITVTHTRFEDTSESNRITGWYKSRQQPVTESTTNTTTIRDCKEEDVRELVKLIREKHAQTEKLLKIS